MVSFSSTNYEYPLLAFPVYQNVTTQTESGTNITTNELTYVYPQIPISCPKHSTIAINPNKTKFGIVSKSKNLKFIAYRIDDSCTNYTQLMISM